jgi:selenocysteine lyase/cysteine desulfurase
MRAFWGYLLGGALRTDDVVLVDRIAYNSHYMALLQAERHAGIRLRVVPSDPEGAIDLEALERMLAAGAAMVTATQVGTHRGLVNPVAEIGRITRAAGVPFFLDACQAVGQMPVDVAAIVAAIEALWPRPVVMPATTSRPANAWRYSGRWWSRPVAARRDRPWY